MGKTLHDLDLDRVFFLSEFIGAKVFWGKKKIGHLSDIIIQESGRIPEVTDFIVRRPFGYQSLLVPWKNIEDITHNRVIIDVEAILPFEKEPADSEILLRDYVLDKKVLDLAGNEVEVVYDVKLILRKNRMYVSDVDFSKYGLLRRMGLKWLANFIYNLADKIKEETLSWDYIQPLEQLSSFSGTVKLKVLKEKLPDIHPVDLADMLEELDHDQRLVIFNQLETEQAADTLEEVEPRVQRDLISSIDVNRAAELINDMTPAQAADVLAILPANDAENILKLLDPDAVKKIDILLKNHDETILNYATSHFLRFSPETKVKHILSQFRHLAKNKDVIMYIYVVDVHDTLQGVVDVKELLQASVEQKLGDIMITHVISVRPKDTLNRVAAMFSRYGFRAIPVTDEYGHILGVLPYRDIMNLKHHFLN